MRISSVDSACHINYYLLHKMAFYAASEIQKSTGKSSGFLVMNLQVKNLPWIQNIIRVKSFLYILHDFK